MLNIAKKLQPLQVDGKINKKKIFLRTGANITC